MIVNMMLSSVQSFVYFIFGDVKDCYFTEQNLKLNFDNYIYMNLLKQNSKYFFIFEGDSASSMRCRPVGKKSCEFFEKIHRKYKEKIYQFDIVWYLLDQMKKTSGITILFNDNLFLEMLENRYDIAKKIKKRYASYSNNSENMILVVSSLGDKNYLKCLDIINIIDDSRNAELLSLKMNQPYCCPYSELHNFLKQRMIVLRQLDYENICSLVNNYFFKHYQCIESIFDYKDWYSAIIWSWYNIDKFRYKYMDLMKGYENPYKKYSIIFNVLGNSAFNNKIKNIISQIPDIENKAPMDYFIEEYGMANDSNILDERDNVIDEICRLYYMISGELPNDLLDIKKLCDRYMIFNEEDTFADNNLIEAKRFVKKQLEEIQRKNKRVCEEMIDYLCSMIYYYFEQIQEFIDPLYEELKYKISQEKFVLYNNLIKLSNYYNDLVSANFEMDIVKIRDCEKMMDRAEILVNLRENSYTDSDYQRMINISKEIKRMI